VLTLRVSYIPKSIRIKDLISNACSVSFSKWCLKISPVQMCGRQRCLAMRLALVPFPDPGAPISTIFIVETLLLEIYKNSYFRNFVHKFYKL